MHEPSHGAALPARRLARWDWKRSALLVALVLGLVGGGNVWLHTRADLTGEAESTARSVRALLQEESNLQWRVLAQEGSALNVAREMGDLRRAEYELLDRLAVALSADAAEEIQVAMHRYHEAIDDELGMIAVGRLSDALAYERRETMPLFDEADALLVDAAARAGASASRARVQATVTLVVALVGVLLLVGLLFRRNQAAHSLAAAAIEARLEQERAVSASLERTRALIHEQAIHDPLTGLLNRLGLREHLRDVVDAADAMLCVVFIDLDNFKAVNDTGGHEEGDRVLCAIADTLRGATRAGELAARVGGDEFNVVAPVDDREQGEALAARLRVQIQATCEREGGSLGLGVSVGSAVGPSADVSRISDEADHLMYAEKQQHRAAGVHR